MDTLSALIQLNAASAKSQAKATNGRFASNVAVSDKVDEVLGTPGGHNWTRAPQSFAQGRGVTASTATHTATVRQETRGRQTGFGWTVKAKATNYTTAVGFTKTMPEAQIAAGRALTASSAQSVSLSNLIALNASSAKNQPKNKDGTFGSTQGGGISDEAKIKNAETMFGTGSKQHLAAQERFKSQAKLGDLEWPDKLDAKPQTFNGKNAPNLTGKVIDTPGHSPERRNVKVGSTGKTATYKDGKMIVYKDVKHPDGTRVVDGVHSSGSSITGHTIRPTQPVRILGTAKPAVAAKPAPETPATLF